ncbi:serine-enriched protein-like isoform X2 [Bolinopsis microptera]|uniref:serine-enriched protein-like isoform X2 n=1 Tax=Bolinopsis microptera TaxID=2820187 RepID=UPI00307ACDC4
MSEITESYPSCDVDNEESTYSYQTYKTEPPVGEEILTKFENRSALAQDLNLLSGLPELCDIIFLVGEDKQPVCAVRAILAARSRVFRKQLYSHVPRRCSLKDAAPRSIKSKSKPPNTIVVPEFEPSVFKQLIEYLHTGVCTLQPRTLFGLVNAADHYDVEELKQACINFVGQSISTDTVCHMLSNADRYIQYKSTKVLIQKVMEFIDRNGDEVLSLPSFSILPKHVVQLIISRESLAVSEVNKFVAVYNWSKSQYEKERCLPLNCDEKVKLSDIVEGFLDYIQFHKIPIHYLMNEVRQSGAVPDTIIMMAVAYQMDPASIDVSKFSRSYSH